MKITQSIGFSILLMVGAVFTARSDDFRTDINPALRYYQAFILAPDLSPTDRDYVFEREWQGQKLPERFGTSIARYDTQFKVVRQAAHATVPCDWGVDMTPGPATLLPHLGRCREIVRVARLRAMWSLQNGQPADARDDLIAGLTLARNSSGDGTLISTLVQIASENIVCSAVAENLYQFSPEILKQLEAGFEAAPARTTVANCMVAENALFHDWLVGKIVELQRKHPGDDAMVMEETRDLITSLDNPEGGQTNQPQHNLWSQVTKASGGTSEGVIKLLHDDLYKRLPAIMALPRNDYEEQVKQFDSEVQSSGNPFVALTFPSIMKCRAKEFAALVELAMVRAGVEYKLNGEAGLKNVTDPCGQGPFELQRFMFQGADRGFELKSAYSGRGFQEVLIFVEKDGPSFHVAGAKAGEPLAESAASKSSSKIHQ
jgi:hypothetical protein